MTYYVNVETGSTYRIHGKFVHRWHNDECKWARSNHVKEADLAHYPFIGIKAKP